MAVEVSQLMEVPGIDVDLLKEEKPQETQLHHFEALSKLLLEEENMMKQLDFAPKEAFNFREADIPTLPTEFRKIAADMTNLDSRGLVKKKVIRPGIGKPVEEGTMVLVAYEMFLEGEKNPFDSTLERKTPAKLIVQPGHVMLGLLMGIRSMLVQEASRLLINYEVAFGELGFPPRIKKQADVLVEIELKKILQVVAPDDLTGEIYYNTNTVDNVLCQCQKILLEAKNLFVKRCFKDSKRKFREGIRLIEHTQLENKEEAEKMAGMKLRMLSNLAGVYSFTNQHEHVCVLCDEILRMDPQHQRGLLLNVRALTRLTNFSASTSLLRRARTLYPNDQDFVKEQTRLNDKKKEFELLGKQK